MQQVDEPGSQPICIEKAANGAGSYERPLTITSIDESSEVGKLDIRGYNAIKPSLLSNSMNGSAPI